MSDLTIQPELNTSATTVEVQEHLCKRLASHDDLTDGTTKESLPEGAIVECDHKGRVVHSRFSGGHLCHFRYDENGRLYGFIYARLAWSSSDGLIWSTQDSINTYVLRAHISVNPGYGTLTVEHDHFTRTIGLNGSFIDTYADGQVQETIRDGVEQKTSDLLAEAIGKNGEPTMQDFSVPQVEQAAILTGEAAKSAAACGLPSPADGIRSEAVQCQNNRRPLAVGKRINRLQVLNEVQPQKKDARKEAKLALKLTCAELKLHILEWIFGPNYVALANCLDEIAEIHYIYRRMNDSREAHERALRIRNLNLGIGHADSSINLHGLAKIYYEWGRYTEAEDQYAQAIRVAGKGLQKARFMRESGITGDAHIIEHIGRLLDSLHALAQLYSAQQRRHLCVELLQIANNVRRSIDGSYCAHFEHLFESMSVLATAGGELDSMRKPAAYTKKIKVPSRCSA